MAEIPYGENVLSPDAVKEMQQKAALSAARKEAHDLHLKGATPAEVYQQVSRFESTLGAAVINELCKEPDFCTDVGNGKRFVRLFSPNIRYVYQAKKWIYWANDRWLLDEANSVNEGAKAVSKVILKEAAMEDDKRAQKEKVDWAMHSQSSARIKATLEMACTMPGVPINEAQLDVDPWLFCVKNGVVNLKTGNLQNAQREDYITKQATVEYINGAECPTWLSFLETITNGDKELISYLQRALGYSLTGSTVEQCMFIGYGTGSNGKSTFLDAVSNILGDYSLNIAPETLMIKKNDGGARGDIVRLKGSRFVTSIESEDGQRLAESMIKSLTGGTDVITARQLYCQEIEFIPTFKLWMATNHKPQVKGTDPAIWRRIHLVPFMVTIQAEKRDKELNKKLASEYTGILNWMMKGCEAWQREGLNPPKCVVDATKEYQTEMDILQHFIEEMCVVDKSHCTPVSIIYNAYKHWADDAGHYALSKSNFGRKLQEKGFTKDPRSNYYGIGLMMLSGSMGHAA